VSGRHHQKRQPAQHPRHPYRPLLPPEGNPLAASCALRLLAAPEVVVASFVALLTLAFDIDARSPGPRSRATPRGRRRARHRRRRGEARRQGGKEARRQGGHGYQSPNRVRRRHESRGADRLTSASEHPYFTAAVACPGPGAPGAAAGATTGRRQRTACATIPGLMHSLAASNRSRDAIVRPRHSR
jgi:hypothetical protein